MNEKFIRKNIGIDVQPKIVHKPALVVGSSGAVYENQKIQDPNLGQADHLVRFAGLPPVTHAHGE